MIYSSSYTLTPFSDLFSGTTRINWLHESKQFWILMKRDDRVALWQWQGNMQIICSIKATIPVSRWSIFFQKLNRQYQSTEDNSIQTGPW